MLDFAALRSKQATMTEIVEGLTRDDLQHLTHEMVDTMLNLVSDCTDADVTFLPQDPEAYDPFAAEEAEIHMAWTLGHVVVHTTASAEESAAVAAELARGVQYHGRSRSEVAWESVTTIAQCRERLEESRRMRLASLDMWPQRPYLDNTYEFFDGQHINAIERFVWGLKHDDDHLGQIAEIVRQAQAAHRARG
jgi:hypothetical protein